MSDPTELANTLFPPPPPFYKEFTSANIARYAELGESSGTSKGRAGPLELDDDDRAELKELEGKLEKPRADWIVEEGRWMCFGQKYDVEPRIPTAEEIGLPRFIDPNEPPQTSLPPLLHSFLHTFLLLLDTLTMTARIPGELEEKGWAHEGDQYIQHLSNLAATMMVSSNQLRDVQAEATLVMLMEKQLATRRQQTAELKSKSKSIADMLVQLRASAATAGDGAAGAKGGSGRDADGDDSMSASGT